MKLIYLLPGKIAVVNEPAEISTILGSCVAIALRDPVFGISGLNHYLLPKVLTHEGPHPRFGDHSILTMVEAMEKLGAQRRRMQAKIYGGADVLEGVDIGKSIGELNILMAEQMMAEMGIPVLEKNVGGTIGRKIKFITDLFHIEHRFMNEKLKVS